MGIYYKEKSKPKVNKLGVTLISVALLLFVILVLPIFNGFTRFIYGIFGLAIYLDISLALLFGIGLVSGRSFYMSKKQIVYLTLTCISVLCLLNCAFFGSVVNSAFGVRFKDFGKNLATIISGKSLTVGGVLFSILTYPFLATLGTVGASLTFGIVSVIFIGLTVDYYLNLKSLYRHERNRRDVYKNNTSLPSSDTIEGNLMKYSNTSDIVPKKVDSKEYDTYYSGKDDNDKDDVEVGEDNIVRTEPESEIDEFNKKYFSNITPNHDYDENLSDDDKATSKYDEGKFKSPSEYIMTPYAPHIFMHDNENENNNSLSDDETDYTNHEEDNTYNTNSDTDEDDAESSYTNSNGPFIFNSLDNSFNGSDRRREFNTRERQIERRETENTANSSPFVGYTPSEFNTADDEEDEDDSTTNNDYRSSFGESRDRGMFNTSLNNPINITPRKENTQIELPGVRKEPKKYKQEQDERYVAPPTSLLDSRPDDPSKYGSDYEEKSKALENVLSSFKIDAKVTDVTRGPSVTQYELAMPFGISVKRVLQYDGDIAAALRSKKGIRIEAPIAGKNAVGVEVPNDSPSTVGLRELLESPEFENSKAILPFVVGKNIYGETIIKSLPKMVHMLVAGSTGSGKSVFLHSILLSLMYKCAPSQLRFILIDPKRVEFTIYSGMPHMMLPNAVSNCDKAINALGWAVKEMERRFDTFQTLSVQNIEDYNHCQQVKDGDYPKIPYIVIVIDELNELMMTGKKEVEEKITRLSQLGRASGIHMIIATQRPSADVVTGTIKNNLPTRVAFALQSGIDSRVILDETGAEKLLGRGDMLIAPYDDNVTSRVQGAFMSMDEVRKVVAYIKEHNESYFDEEVAKEILADKPAPVEDNSGSSIAGNLEPDEDELLPAALKLCMDTGGASINMVQRRFRVGYARAARIIDQMELAGYISPGNGSKLRQIYITPEEYREKFGDGN